MAPLTLDEQKIRRESTIQYLTSNEVNSKPIEDFLETEFKCQDSNGKDFIPTHFVKNKYNEKTKKVDKWGSKSSLTLADYKELSETGKVAGKNDWKPYVSKKEGEYFEVRPCLAKKQMCIVDFDGWKTSGDITLEELFNMDELPEIFADCSFFLSRTKSLPHFIFYIEDLPEHIKIGNYINVIKGFEADILFNHAWELKESLLYNYPIKEGLATISWKDLELLVDTDPTNLQAKKLLAPYPQIWPKPKPKPTPQPQPQPKEDGDNVSEVTHVSAYDSKSGEKESKVIEEIKDLTKAILESKSTFFDSYAMWSQLGFLINNETSGSEQGCECFIELTALREKPEPVPDSQCGSTYHATQKGRDKSNKLKIASLRKWLKEVNPDHPLLEKEGIPMSPDELRKTKMYLDYRTKFEEIHFKLNNPTRYCELDSDNTLIFREAKVFSERMRDEYDMPIFMQRISDDKAIPKKFYELWLDDTSKRKHSKIVFDTKNLQAESAPDKITEYNAFKGFVNDTKADPIDPEKSDVIKLMKYLFCEEIVFEYMMCWVACIIQKPWMKSKVAPVLYSETHGTGKNSFIDALVAIIGKELCALVESIEDITKNFNSHLCNKLLIYGDEISAKAKGVADKLKNVITRSEQNLEKKGVDPVKVQDNSNWMFTCNTVHFKIEKEDRRLLLSHCNEKAQTDYSVKSYAEIADQNKLESLFSYFKAYTQSEESIKKFGKFNVGTDKVISTDYKCELLYENRPAYVKMLFKNYKEFIFYQRDKGITPSELYDMSQKFAKANYMSSNFTPAEFNKQIQPYIGKFGKHGNTGNFYKFPAKEDEWLHHLYKVDEPYYRYINQLPADFVPDFKSEP